MQRGRLHIKVTTSYAATFFFLLNNIIMVVHSSQLALSCGMVTAFNVQSMALSFVGEKEFFNFFPSKSKGTHSSISL